jgi:hypothetical protein
LIGQKVLQNKNLSAAEIDRFHLVSRMALPAGDLEGGHAGSPERKGRAGKKIAVAVGAAFAVAACVALAMAPSRGNRVSELVAISPAAHRSLDELAMNMLKHAATMPESQMLDMLRAWRDQPGTVLSTLLPKPDGPNARTEMLVGTLRYELGARCLDSSAVRGNLFWASVDMSGQNVNISAV